MTQRWIGLVVGLGLVVESACSRAIDLEDPDDRELAIQTDVETLCRRARENSMSAWGQPVMITEDVGSITHRMDQQDPSAYCELGRLMQQRGPEDCQATATSLLSHCDEGGASANTGVIQRSL